jgi:CheY-like chemotaxis protein
VWDISHPIEVTLSLRFGETDATLETPSMPPLVLLIEDDDDIREVVGDVFEGRGMTVLRARNGRHAIGEVRARGVRPDAIILDLTMPEMDGAEFLAAQEREPLLVQVPVVIATAQIDHPDPLPSVVRQILVKPVPLAQLFAAVSGLVRGTIDPPTATLAKGTGRLSSPLDDE